MWTYFDEPTSAMEANAYLLLDVFTPDEFLWVDIYYFFSLLTILLFTNSSITSWSVPSLFLQNHKKVPTPTSNTNPTFQQPKLSSLIQDHR
jgi:hypothetical protein